MTITSGILLVDKPYGLSSNHALQKVKRLLSANKAGHAGTLDPLATGMLPILVNEATKYAQFLIDADKVYAFTMQLGVQTTTGDSEGDIIATMPVPAFTQSQLDQVISSFHGPITQTPPQYSAIKIKGKPAYEYARAGQHVDIKARVVTIKRLQLLTQTTQQLSLEVECSKGTYIRSLAEAIGSALGVGAHVTDLRRLSTGVFQMPMYRLEDISPTTSLKPIDSMLAHLPKLELNPAQIKALYCGQTCGVDHDMPPQTSVRLYDQADIFIGLGELFAEKQLKPQRLLAQQI